MARAARESLNDADVAAFAEAVRRIAPMPDEALAPMLPLLRARSLARGATFLRGGAEAREVGLVRTGLLREHFVLEDGTERTKAFVAEGEFTGSLADLVSGGPSRAFIVAEEPTRMLVASYADYARIAADSRAWERFALASAHALVVRKAEREYELLGLSAEARYAVFAERYPGLEARIAARHVASYLGITPVHLSRLRRRRRERPVAGTPAPRSPRSR